MMHKWLVGKEKIDFEDLFEMSKSNLRGHSMKITKRRDDVQKYSFPDIATDQWNALPEQVVCVHNIQTFKENTMSGY